MNIEAVYCINLEHRKERWEAVQPELRKLHMDITRFLAVNEQPGWVGCRKSHLAVLDYAKELKCFMIVEDDVQFIIHPLRMIYIIEKQLPPDWDMLYLGAHLLTPLERYSENLFRLKNGYTTHAIIYNNPDMVRYILSQADSMRKIDVFYQTEIQEKYKVFITWPMTATQSNSYSDITRRYNEYSNDFIKKFNKMTK